MVASRRFIVEAAMLFCILVDAAGCNNYSAQNSIMGPADAAIAKSAKVKIIILLVLKISANFFLHLRINN
jgi:hypothetical protein